MKKVLLKVFYLCLIILNIYPAQNLKNNQQSNKFKKNPININSKSLEWREKFLINEKISQQELSELAQYIYYSVWLLKLTFIPPNAKLKQRQNELRNTLKQIESKLTKDSLASLQDMIKGYMNIYNSKQNAPKTIKELFKHIIYHYNQIYRKLKNKDITMGPLKGNHNLPGPKQLIKLFPNKNDFINFFSHEGDKNETK